MNSILIQTDFDNTVTIGNVSELIHEEFGPKNWPEIYENYKRGMITVEESNIYSFKSLKTKKIDLDNFVKNNVKFREGFLEFYNYVNENGLDFKIVSSGVDFYIYSALSSVGIDPKSVEIISGKSIFNSEGISVQYFDSTNLSMSENFKGTYTKFHKQIYSKIIYFGDSYTDLISAKISDVIFATDKLQFFFEKENIEHFAFSNYFEVLDIFQKHDLT